MKTLFSCLSILLSLSSFAQTDSRRTVLTDSTMAILQADTSAYCMWKLEGLTPIEPGLSDIAVVDSLLQLVIAERTNPGTPFFCGMELRDYPYYYQLIAGKNSGGETVIWVNAFCPGIVEIPLPLTRREKRQQRKGRAVAEAFDWRNNIVIGFDGCGCFWELKVNVGKRSYTDLYVSGM